MRKTYQCGRIFVSGECRDDVIYDVCSNEARVVFDGKGGIAEYSLCNQAGSLLRDCTTHVYINGEMLDVFSPKKVKLAGRTATVTLKSGETQIEFLQFVAPNERAVFCEIRTNRPGDYEFALDLNHAQHGFHYATDAADRFDDENKSIYLRVRRNARFILSFDTMTNCSRCLAEFDKYKKQVDGEIRRVQIPASAPVRRAFDEIIRKLDFN